MCFSNVLSILKSNEKIEQDTLEMDAAQTQVIKWALKNGFHFKTPEEEELYQSITEGNPEYVEVDSPESGFKGGYIFKTDVPRDEQIIDGKIGVRFILVKDIMESTEDSN